MNYKLCLQLYGDDSGEGSQAAADTTGEGTEQAAAAEETFESLIGKGGKYKADFDKKVQGIIDHRFKGAKANETKLSAIEPILGALSTKYGLKADDIDGISKAVTADNSYYEEKAMEMGLTVEQYRQMAVVEAENQRLKQIQREASAREQLAVWEEEAKSIQSDFPEFDLMSTLQDSRVQSMLKSGVDLRSAYTALNMDRIMPQVMGYTAQEAAKKTAQNIASRGARPMENGISGVASASTKTDVSKLSNADIADLVERAQKGEVIRFS